MNAARESSPRAIAREPRLPRAGQLGRRERRDGVGSSASISADAGRRGDERLLVAHDVAALEQRLDDRRARRRRAEPAVLHRARAAPRRRSPCRRTPSRRAASPRCSAAAAWSASRATASVPASSWPSTSGGKTAAAALAVARPPCRASARSPGDRLPAGDQRARARARGSDPAAAAARSRARPRVAGGRRRAARRLADADPRLGHRELGVAVERAEEPPRDEIEEPLLVAVERARCRPVGMIAWWSRTLPSSTTRRLGAAACRRAAAANGAYAGTLASAANTAARAGRRRSSGGASRCADRSGPCAARTAPARARACAPPMNPNRRFAVRCSDVRSNSSGGGSRTVFAGAPTRRSPAPRAIARDDRVARARSSSRARLPCRHARGEVVTVRREICRGPPSSRAARTRGSRCSRATTIASVGVCTRPIE